MFQTACLAGPCLPYEVEVSDYSQVKSCGQWNLDYQNWCPGLKITTGEKDYHPKFKDREWDEYECNLCHHKEWIMKVIYE